MHIVICSSEVVPFAKTGGLADVCGALPLELEKLGARVTVVMPRYRGIGQKKFGLKALNSQVNSLMISKDVQVLFIENEGYFDREGLYGDFNGDYPDNLDRFQFFCKRTLGVLRQLNLKTDILHCHDWQAALIPAMIRWQLNKEAFFQRIKSILTIHNLAFQGIFPKEGFDKLGFESSLYQQEGYEYHGKINLLKGGILFSDAVTTVSPQYARDIQGPEFGCGLDGVLRTRKDGVHGILNGLDYSIWDPVHDPLIAANYSARDLAGKAQNKKKLQEAWGLAADEKAALIGFVGRLSHQKGIDLILDAARELTQRPVQLALIGNGDNGYEDQLRKFAAKYPGRVLVHTDFNEKLAHMVYAASDLFLMPSVFEPCGLSQMIALRYGSIPIVYRTGGLADTVKPCAKGGNGFVFNDYTPEDFLKAVDEALAVYADRGKFAALQKRAFQSHFSWGDSARQYLNLFEQCLSGTAAV